MNKNENQAIESCPFFMNGRCQKYFDGDCSAHICDLKVIRELEQQLQAKKQECEHWKNHCLCLDGEDVTVQISQEQFEEYQKYKQVLDDIESYCNEQNLKYDTTACASLDIIDKAKDGE